MKILIMKILIGLLLWILGMTAWVVIIVLKPVLWAAAEVTPKRIHLHPMVWTVLKADITYRSFLRALSNALNY